MIGRTKSFPCGETFMFRCPYDVPIDSFLESVNDAVCPQHGENCMSENPVKPAERRTKMTRPDTDKIRERLRELKQYRKLDDACKSADLLADTLEKVLDECEEDLESPADCPICTDRAREIIDVIQNELCEEVDSDNR